LPAVARPISATPVAAPIRHDTTNLHNSVTVPVNIRNNFVLY
jgi:hypothetical protein